MFMISVPTPPTHAHQTHHDDYDDDHVAENMNELFVFHFIAGITYQHPSRYFLTSINHDEADEDEDDV